MSSSSNNNASNDNNECKNVTRDNGSLLMEVISNKNQMSTDVKTLLNKNLIKNIAFITSYMI